MRFLPQPQSKVPGCEGGHVQELKEALRLRETRESSSDALEQFHQALVHVNKVLLAEKHLSALLDEDCVTLVPADFKLEALFERL